MAAPVAGRLPKDALRIVAPTFTRIIPISLFGGVNGASWKPRDTSETVTLYWYEPRFAVSNALNVRVHWSTSNSTTTNSATFRVLYSAFTIDSTALAMPASALSTTIAADNPATANCMLRTAAGVLNGGTVTDGQALMLSLNCSAVSGLTLNSAAASNDNVTVWAVELEYVLSNL